MNTPHNTNTNTNGPVFWAEAELNTAQVTDRDFITRAGPGQVHALSYDPDTNVVSLDRGPAADPVEVPGDVLTAGIGEVYHDHALAVVATLNEMDADDTVVADAASRLQADPTPHQNPNPNRTAEIGGYQFTYNNNGTEVTITKPDGDTAAINRFDLSANLMVHAPTIAADSFQHTAHRQNTEGLQRLATFYELDSRHDIAAAFTKAATTTAPATPAATPNPPSSKALGAITRPTNTPTPLLGPPRKDTPR